MWEEEWTICCLMCRSMALSMVASTIRDRTRMAFAVKREEEEVVMSFTRDEVTMITSSGLQESATYKEEEKFVMRFHKKERGKPL